MILSFSFGKNWEEFVKKHYSEERVAASKKHILDFLGLQNLNGKYFLDIGCGSGLSSLAAFYAGTKKILSFDIDENAVKTTEKLRESGGKPDNWIVKQGSILDADFLSKIPKADIVYAWGSLHHTGDMWKAIENSAKLMKRNGLFYVALYNTTPKSAYWLKIKKRYSNAGEMEKRLMEFWYLFYKWLPGYTLSGNNPIKYILDYKKDRGMSFLTDARDWLGGLPFEHTSKEKMKAFCRKVKLGCTKIWHSENVANTEYLFKRR